MLGESTSGVVRCADAPCGRLQLLAFALPPSSPCALKDRQLFYVNGRCVRCPPLGDSLEAWFRAAMAAETKAAPGGGQDDERYQQARYYVI